MGTHTAGLRKKRRKGTKEEKEEKDGKEEKKGGMCAVPACGNKQFGVVYGLPSCNTTLIAIQIVPSNARKRSSPRDRCSSSHSRQRTQTACTMSGVDKNFCELLKGSNSSYNGNLSHTPVNTPGNETHMGSPGNLAHTLVTTPGAGPVAYVKPFWVMAALGL
jgi:hypothetical protein